MTKEPWRGLPSGVADLIEPDLDATTDEILATIAREVPEYARPLEGNFGRAVRTGVTEALSPTLISSNVRFSINSIAAPVDSSAFVCASLGDNRFPLPRRVSLPTSCLRPPRRADLHFNTARLRAIWNCAD